ncbi:hypothetical protein SPRG_06555 [Saprolegnia parasitica CBS 223.65]|uniref:Uncharacterized protein n=1 Tax=Saprolegnia parasitica (strain CBS 223.65) TaxID=695850 RepID=A0A067CQC3_SAPPC|nr:hypothetical protein SPRG_06555 [Saprolegnia parasitica CBS 223.65]KDO28701.1 hypothetical protein SPRG_06555 [Saprolegnia parasitica CBS 223.65]|eukprot:XP_012200759.1 hypothetical protein SPRG_06555 [Saprolegnia parasitica CBS 223.65]
MFHLFNVSMSIGAALKVDGTLRLSSLTRRYEPPSKKRKGNDELTVTAAMAKEEPVEITSQQLKGLKVDNEELRGDNKELRDQLKPLVADNLQLPSRPDH